MRLTVAALIAAAAVAAASSPAAACGFFSCVDQALADDSYPMGSRALDPDVQMAVHARAGFGLSSAGFYNDPSLAMARREVAAPRYDVPPPPFEPVAYGEPAPDAGPQVILNPWAPPHREARSRYASGHHRGVHY